MRDAAVDSLFAALMAADRKGAVAVAERWAGEHGWGAVVARLLEPTLMRLGAAWAGPEPVSLAVGYMAGKVAEDVMLRAAAELDQEVMSSSGGIAVIGNIEDDYHALGRRMVGTFLRSAGWTVHDLGNDVLPERFVDTALEVGASVIGASAMMLSTARNILELREEIDRRGLAGRLRLAVGGAAFIARPELTAEVGGDGTARNALVAVELFERLAAGAGGGG